MTAIAFGGSSGANELRFATSGSGGTGSASWGYVTRPSSGVAAVAQLWAFTADTTGNQIVAYDGSRTNANQLKWNWDNLGTMVSAPQFSLFGDTAHTTPSAGTQPGSPISLGIANGHATDTSSTSYCKINALGQFGTSTSNVTAGAVGTTLSATVGTAGSVSPTSGANWLATWQSAQGWISYITAASTPTALTAAAWNWVVAMFTGVNQATGQFAPVFTMQYLYS